MSQRPGVLTTSQAASPKPPWPADAPVPDPRSQVDAITAEVRAHWPSWAAREAVLDEIAKAAFKADEEARAWFDAHEVAP